MSNPSSHVKRSWGQRSNLSCFRPQHDEFREPCTKELESGYPDGPYMFDVYLKAEFLHFIVHSSTKCIRFLPFSLGADEIVESNPVKAKEAYIYNLWGNELSRSLFLKSPLENEWIIKWLLPFQKLIRQQLR